MQPLADKLKHELKQLRLGSTDKQLKIGIWTDGANRFNCSCDV